MSYTGQYDMHISGTRAPGHVDTISPANAALRFIWNGFRRWVDGLGPAIAQHDAPSVVRDESKSGTAAQSSSPQRDAQ